MPRCPLSRQSRQVVITLLISLTLVSCVGGRLAVSPEFRDSSPIKPRHHALDLSIDPSAHALTATDRVTLSASAAAVTSTAFYLTELATVQRVSIGSGPDERAVPFHRQQPRLPRTPFSHQRYAAFGEMTRYAVDLPAGQTAGQSLVLTIQYSGRWPETPDHDQAVNEHGALLTGEDGWYPLWPDALFTFDLTIDHPAGWEAVSAGRQTFRTESGGRLSTAWSMAQPTESIDLIAGPYTVTARQSDGVTLQTYLFAEEAALSPVYLDAATAYLARYSRLLGPYPFPKLAIVETPAPIGAATPSMVLLGRPLIRRHYIQPYALGHEIVHAWFGNSVMADESDGNWTEALTTYVANYHTVAEEQGEAAARQQRLRMLWQYAAQVPPERDYPLMRFLHNDSQTDAAIGYQKGAFVFHMLKRMMGGDEFFAALRDLTERYRGKRASWNDLRLLFEARLGQPLDWFFRQWVVEAGAPQVVIKQVTITPLPPAPSDPAGPSERAMAENAPPGPPPGLPPGLMVSITLRQSPPFFRIPVVVQIESDNRILEKSIWMEHEQAVIDTAMATPPLRVAVDPNVQLFRRLDRDELPPMLNLTLTEPVFAILPPERSGADLIRDYQAIANGARQRHNAQAARPGTGAADLPSWLVLGGPDENREAAELTRPPATGSTSRLPPGVEIGPKRFTIGGHSYDGAGHALLLSFRDPARENRPVTLFYGLSADAVTPLGPLLFYHGWDSYIVFDMGHAVTTGELPAERFPLLWTPPQEPSQSSPTSEHPLKPDAPGETVP
jgi:aminopeptidase N